MADSEVPFETDGEYKRSEFDNIRKVCSVYVVYNILSDCRYVGKAKGTGSCFTDHYEGLRKRVLNNVTNKRLLWDLDRLGKGVTPYRFAILERSDPVNYSALEIEWIHKIKANYNLKPNGTEYYPMPPEFYEKTNG